MTTEKMTALFENVRKGGVLVHCITNYVTVNDVANIVLACGASPIMADDIHEAADITRLCTATCINIGTLNARTVTSMAAAGKAAVAAGHPVLLDPVGAGASSYRTKTAFSLIKQIPFTVIRGNMSEIRTIAGGIGRTQGVDASAADRVTEENLAASVRFVQNLAVQTRAVIAVSGAIDIIADGQRAFVCRNGHPLMSRITGTGCMLSALTAAFAAANQDSVLEAAAAAFAVMGLSGEIAQQKTADAGGGTGSFRSYLIDAVSTMSAGALAEGAKLDEYKA